jgi:hypothetical protein
VVFLWEKVEPIAEAHRETTNPDTLKSFEFLANEIDLMLERKLEESKTTGN